MNEKETIDSTDKLLKNALNIKKQVMDMDTKIKKNENKAEFDKLKEERFFLYNKLSKINNAIGALTDKEQKLICYKYFENMGYKDIGIKLSFSEGTTKKLLDLCRLHIGRILFGMEDDFWDKI